MRATEIRMCLLAICTPLELLRHFHGRTLVAPSSSHDRSLWLFGGQAAPRADPTMVDKSSGKTGVDRDRTPSDTTDGPSAFALAAPQPQRVE